MKIALALAAAVAALMPFTPPSEPAEGEIAYGGSCARFDGPRGSVLLCVPSMDPDGNPPVRIYDDGTGLYERPNLARPAWLYAADTAKFELLD